MEKDFKSWMVRGHQNVQLNAKPSALPFNAGLQNISTVHGGNDPISLFPFQPKPKETTQPNHRFYHLPGFVQNLPPKQFLVFDQTGDKTTLIYSSGIDTPLCLNPWSSNPKAKLNLEKQKLGSEIHASGPSLTDELNANYSEAEEESEMREDTEEINALLYSDDEDEEEDDSGLKEEEDDDVVSTGHSPSIITAYNDYGEEVASSDGPIKRQRISEDSCLSAKPNRNFYYEDDAESKCTDNSTRNLNDTNKKRSIRETVEILQSIIPCSQGKRTDAALVLDESIRYLRSLRAKAGSVL